MARKRWEGVDEVAGGVDYLHVAIPVGDVDISVGISGNGTVASMTEGVGETDGSQWLEGHGIEDIDEASFGASSRKEGIQQAIVAESQVDGFDGFCEEGDLSGEEVEANQATSLVFDFAEGFHVGQEDLITENIDATVASVVDGCPTGNGPVFPSSGDRVEGGKVGVKGAVVDMNAAIATHRDITSRLGNWV